MKTDLNGLIEGIAIGDYHKMDGFSSTGVGYFLDAPAIYKNWKTAGDDNETESKQLGGLFHEATLEPQLFADRYVHIPGPLNKNPWKAMKDEAEAKGKTAIGDTMYKNATGMRDAALSHKRVQALLSGAIVEHSAFWKDPEYGFLAKCRPDAFRIRDGIVTDFKSISDVPTLENMKKAIRKWKYQIKAKFYLDGLSIVTGTKLRMFVHVFVQSKSPYLVNFCALSDDDMVRSGIILDDVRRRYAQCLETDIWPGLEDKIHTVAMDYWDYPEENT